MLEEKTQELEMKLYDLYAGNGKDAQALCEFKPKLQKLCDDHDEQQSRVHQRGCRIQAILKAWFFEVPEHEDLTLQECWRRLTDRMKMAGPAKEADEPKTNTLNTCVSGKGVPTQN